ncbi:MAG: HGxxPAAW family protein [Nocardioidaceae bacterium]
MADNHGSTPAAWVTVFLALVAFVVGGIALVFDPVNWVLFWIGVALLPVAMLVGKAMSAMGLGAAEHERQV